MHYGPALSTLRTVMTTAATIDAPIPKAIAADYATLTALGDRVRAFAQHELADRVGARVLDALADDRDPTTDPDVNQALTARTLLTITGTFDAALATRAQQVLEDHAPAIAEAHRRPFDQAAAAIAEAFAVLGAVDLGDTRTVLGAGGAAAESWAQAQTATRTIASIVKSYKMLSMATAAIPYQHRHPLLLITDPAPGDYIDNATTVTDPWTATVRGWPLDYATPDTYTARVDAITTEQTRRQAHTDDAFRRDYQRHRGIPA